MSKLCAGLAFVLALGGSVACGGDDGTSEPEGLPAECNPLGNGVSCMMPWPSSTYLVEDASTQTGYRVDLPFEAMPTNADGITIDPVMFNNYDGFGNAAPILAAFETGVSAEGLPPHTDVGAAFAADAPVVVINMETRQRLTIFAEVDMNASNPLERALIIRPLERMQPGTRYAVAIRKSVKAADGSDLPLSPAFAAIVAGEDFKHPRFEGLAAGYDEIFAVLEDDGISRNDLVLAWDFVTASDEFLTADILAMREQALPVMGDAGENLSFQAEEIAPTRPELALRLVVGTYDTPMFLDDGEKDLSILNRDANGVPELVGMGTANFSAVIPRCVETEEAPVPVIIFGHGLFGNANDYIDDRFLQEVANDNCVVIIGGDWIGLTNRQLVAVAYAMNDMNRGLGITEKLAQAVISFTALQRISRSTFRTDDMFKVDGREIIDPTRVYYYGASLGGIMGGVFMSYDPDILKGVLGVAGGPWSLLYERSLAWPPLRVAMQGAYSLNPFDYQQNISLMGTLFEKVDPITTARRVLADPLPDTPAKQIFIYAGIGDTLVNNPASWTLARTMGLSVCGPSLLVPFGMVEELAPETSALTIYDEGVSPHPPLVNVAPEDDNGTHSHVNERAAVQRQVTTFINEGEVRNACVYNDAPAPCICSTGACD